MFDIALRRLKDQITSPISHYVPLLISPDHVTFLALICGLASCYFTIASSKTSYSVSLWLLNRLLDCLDGSLARSRRKTTELGGFLDLLSDFIIYSLIPISVALGQEKHSPVDWRAIAGLEASFHVNNFVLFYIAAVASKRDAGELTSVTMRPALIEGFESGLLFTAMLVWPRWLSSLSWGMCVAVCIGIGQRVWALYPILKRLDQQGRQQHKLGNSQWE